MIEPVFQDGRIIEVSLVAPLTDDEMAVVRRAFEQRNEQALIVLPGGYLQVRERTPVRFEPDIEDTP